MRGTFQKDKNYLIDRINLYNTKQLDRESLETFFLRLSGQAAQCGWALENEKEIVRDIFIAKMKFKDIQRDLCIRPGNSPEETLKSALFQEKEYVTASTLQKQMGLSGPASSNSNFGQNHPNSFKIKQEPTLSVQRQNNIQNRTNRAQNPRGKPKNRPNNTQERDNKPCYFCGKEFSPNHKLSCPAKNLICKNCNKKGHFARCCNSRRDVGIVDDDSEITAEEECDFIASDSEP